MTNYKDIQEILLYSLKGSQQLFQDSGDDATGDLWGIPETLALYDLSLYKDEEARGAWLPNLERAVEVAYGHLVLSQVEDFARYAQWLISKGATSPDTKLKNSLVDGYSYARGQLPRFISEEEAEAEHDLRYPNCKGLNPDSDGYITALVKDMKQGTPDQYPDYDLIDKLPGATSEKPYLQRFELELWLSWQASAAYFKFVPCSFSRDNYETYTYTWEYHAREIGHDAFEIAKPGDVSREDSSDRDYAGSTTYNVVPEVKKGFWITRDFSRVFTNISLVRESYKEMLDREVPNYGYTTQGN